jgi:hypothetical protein
MGKLDALVTDHLVERLFQPRRLATILASLSSRRTEKAEALSTRITALQWEVSDADEKLKRLYRLVEDGMTDLDEVLKDRLTTLKSERDRANAALDRAKAPCWFANPNRSCIDRAVLPHPARKLHDRLSAVPQSLPVIAYRCN